MSDPSFFQNHHAIGRAIGRSSQALDLLSKNNLFDMDAFENRLDMPADRGLAQAFDLSPHNGGHLGAYTRGVRGALEEMERSQDYAAALMGDQAASGRFSLDEILGRRELEDGRDAR